MEGPQCIVLATSALRCGVMVQDNMDCTIICYRINRLGLRQWLIECVQADSMPSNVIPQFPLFNYDREQTVSEHFSNEDKSAINLEEIEPQPQPLEYDDDTDDDTNTEQIDDETLGSTQYDLQGEGEFCYPLYTGGTLTLGLSLVLIMSFVANHGITDAALQDLLTIISLLLIYV